MQRSKKSFLTLTSRASAISCWDRKKNHDPSKCHLWTPQLGYLNKMGGDPSSHGSWTTAQCASWKYSTSESWTAGTIDSAGIHTIFCRYKGSLNTFFWPLIPRFLGFSHFQSPPRSFFPFNATRRGVTKSKCHVLPRTSCSSPSLSSSTTVSWSMRYPPPLPTPQPSWLQNLAVSSSQLWTLYLDEAWHPITSTQMDTQTTDAHFQVPLARVLATRALSGWKRLNIKEGHPLILIRKDTKSFGTWRFVLPWPTCD